MEKQHSRGEREHNQIDRLGAKRGDAPLSWWII